MNVVLAGGGREQRPVRRIGVVVVLDVVRRLARRRPQAGNQVDVPERPAAGVHRHRRRDCRESPRGPLDAVVDLDGGGGSGHLPLGGELHLGGDVAHLHGRAGRGALAEVADVERLVEA